MNSVNTAPPEDAAFVEAWRDHENRVLLGHVRRQRPEGPKAASPVEDPDQHDTACTEDLGPTMAVFDRSAVLAQIRLATGQDFVGGETTTSSASGEEQTRLVRLRTLAGEEPLRRLVIGDAGMRERLARLRTECPGFIEVIALIERAVALSAVSKTGTASPAILLVGPPGLGKTHFSRRLAEALGIEQHVFSCATNSDAQALLIGHPPTWRGARMGVLTEALLGGETGNPLVLLDEIDKFVTHSTEKPYNSLLSLLEPENACALVDEYLRIPFDLSRCLIIATANDLDLLPDFIQDRFLVVRVAPPSGAMLRAIASRIATEIIAAHGDAFGHPEEAVVARLATTHPRGIRRLVTLALGFAAEAGRRHLVVADVASAEAIADIKSARTPIGFIPGKSKGEMERE
ncbi:AAA family ATPase [Bosea sp. TND4EK4]|uniref:AAA family ATPase n=1 Tax=Bosea sp. TND4EK4 TaxID=1907408 RepID=UPI0009541A9F|nr:AAA family ATPase [Bosea sp. TND4EK4]SIR56105.1 ATP-dependent Lon protease [Bosea sp. TND4EK4]